MKQITTGEGGAIVSNDAMIGERVKRLRGHGIELRHDQSPHERGSWYYEMVELGFNYRITDIQCALGLTQLKKLDSFVKRRREIARRYDEALSGDCRFILPLVANENNHAYHLYPLQINFDDINASKKEIFERLARHGIRLQVHYIPIYKHPYYRNLGFQGMELENAENFYRRVVSLPIYPTLREIEQEHVINTLLKECN